MPTRNTSTEKDLNIPMTKTSSNTNEKKRLNITEKRPLPTSEKDLYILMSKTSIY